MCPVPGQCCPAWAGAQSTRVKKADGRPHGVPPRPLPGSARLEVSRTPQLGGPWGRLSGPIHLCRPRPSVLDSSAPGTWSYRLPQRPESLLWKAKWTPCSPWGTPCTCTTPCSLSPRGWNHCLSPRALPQLHTKMGPRAGFAGRWMQVAFHSLFQGGGAGTGSRVLAKHAVCVSKDPAGLPPQGPGLGTGPPAAELTHPRPPSRSKNPKHPSHLGRHQAEPTEGGKHLCNEQLANS